MGANLQGDWFETKETKSTSSNKVCFQGCIILENIGIC